MDAIALLPVASALVVVALLVLFRNSLPLAWTIRTTIPYMRVRMRYLTSRFSTSTTATTSTAHANGTLTKHGQHHGTAQQVTAPSTPSAQGCDPFEDLWTWRHRATLDDCDLLSGHMSNSAYPKNLDVARTDYAVHRLADFIRDGGWIALGSTSFTFHRDIPVLARYTIVSRIETWNDKWLYLRNEFRGRTGHGDETAPVLYCTSITKHCFKYGRKTIPPWFVLAYCGYTGASEATLRATNATRSRELRQSLLHTRRSGNPLQAFERVSAAERALRKVSAWCTPEAWDVQGWEKQRAERMDVLKETM